MRQRKSRVRLLDTLREAEECVPYTSTLSRAAGSMHGILLVLEMKHARLKDVVLVEGLSCREGLGLSGHSNLFTR